MALEAVVDTLDGVEEAFHALYSERDGKFEITGINGMKTTADVDRLQSALGKERIVSGGFKTKLTAFGDHTAESIQTLTDSNSDLAIQLEAAKKDGGPSDEDLDKMAESRAVMRIRPIERDLAKVTKQLEEITGERNTLAASQNKSKIVSAVERAGVTKDVGVQKDVMASGDLAAWAERAFEVVDGVVVTREGINGVNPGITPDQALLDMKEGNSRPYWFGPTVGAGATGGKGGEGSTEDNPFAIDKITGTPVNLTKASAIYRTDPARAARLFKAAGKGAEDFFPMLAGK